MARKQVGQIDADLLARVDALASQRGQTRRVVVERALEAVLSEESAPFDRALESTPGAATGPDATGQTAGSLPPAPAPTRTHDDGTAARALLMDRQARIEADRAKARKR